MKRPKKNLFVKGSPTRSPELEAKNIKKIKEEYEKSGFGRVSYVKPYKDYNVVVYKSPEGNWMSDIIIGGEKAWIGTKASSAEEALSIGKKFIDDFYAR